MLVLSESEELVPRQGTPSTKMQGLLKISQCWASKFHTARLLTECWENLRTVVKNRATLLARNASGSYVDRSSEHVKYHSYLASELVRIPFKAFQTFPRRIVGKISENVSSFLRFDIRLVWNSVCTLWGNGDNGAPLCMQLLEGETDSLTFKNGPIGRFSCHAQWLWPEFGGSITGKVTRRRLNRFSTFIVSIEMK